MPENAQNAHNYYAHVLFQMFELLTDGFAQYRLSVLDSLDARKLKFHVWIGKAMTVKKMEPLGLAPAVFVLGNG